MAATGQIRRRVDFMKLTSLEKTRRLEQFKVARRTMGLARSADERKPTRFISLHRFISFRFTGCLSPGVIVKWNETQSRRPVPRAHARKSVSL
jgi:hypothetical protein